MAEVDSAMANAPAAGMKMARVGQRRKERIGDIVAVRGEPGVASQRLRLRALAAALAACGGLGGCAWWQTKERELALRPSPGRPADADRALSWQPDDRRYLVAAASAPGQRLSLWWLPQADPRAPAMLYLHGTLRTLYGNAPKIAALRRAGFAILAVDYRGWGDSTAMVPSEETIVADAWQAWAELCRHQPDPARRVIFGHSMGSAVAVHLASQLHWRTDYGALALESAFTNLPDVAAEAGFWGRIGAAITTLQFDAVSRIGAVDAPLWMLHGDADTTVPVVLGRRLRDAARPGVHWVEVPGGSHSRLHDDAPALYDKTYRDLLASLVAADPSRPTPPPRLAP